MKLTSNKLFGFIYFRYFRSVLHQTPQEIRDLDFFRAWTRTRLARALISYDLQKSSGRIRYTTTTITSFKRRRRGSLKHSTRKGRGGQAARRSQLLHTAWAKPVLVFGALETFCIDSLSICRRSNRKHAELRAKTLAHLTHLQRNFVPQNYSDATTSNKTQQLHF